MTEDEFAARLMTRIDTSGGDDACHNWTAFLNPLGYGRTLLNGRHVMVHRWLLGYLRGHHLERGEMACHHCDNPSCVNPHHLYVGNIKTNTHDMISRKRHHLQRRTHCANGHEFDLANTYWRPSGGRACRLCQKQAAIRYSSKQRLAAARTETR